MIVERYLEWASIAPSHLRAEAAAALARCYLHGGLEPVTRTEIAAALVRALDDPSVAVRAALADALCASPEAPHAIVLSLAQDGPEVAEPVLVASPVLTDFELVDLLAQGCGRVQVAIARRLSVSAPLSAALAEVGSARACETLLHNPGARLTRGAAARIAARHGHDGGVRDALLACDELGPELRQILMRSVAAALSSFVAGRGWLQPDRARRAADEACDRGALALAAESPDARRFVLHLAERGEFSASLALRALLGGDLALFEAALSALSGQDPRRIAGFVRDAGGRGFAAVYAKAGFPAASLPVFRAALVAGREAGAFERPGARISRIMVERALAACAGEGLEIQSLRALLRRFAAEATREDARREYPDAIAVAA